MLRDAKVGDKTVWADSAYRSDEQECRLQSSQNESQIHGHPYLNQPLTATQELSNTEKSRIRARVEHVFGHMENAWVASFCAALARAAVGVGLMNLTYNLKRIEVLIRLKRFDFERIGAPKLRPAA